MNRRGAALPIVFALVTVVLVMGLAMGTLSTLSLQFSRRQLEGIRAEMAARGAIAQLLATVREHDAEAELNPLKPEPSNVSELFPEGLHFQEGDHRVVVDFDTTEPGFSSDNLGGDAPRIGWPDDDDVPRIPPFALDVVLNVEGPSSKHRFRAGLKRVWPFALYSKRGPVVLMAIPGTGGAEISPSQVKGDVYTSWEGLAAGGGTVLSGYGYGLLNDPSKVLANLEARAGYQSDVQPQGHLLVGARLGYNPPIEVSDVHPDSTPQEKFYRYNLASLVRQLDQVEDAPTFSPQILLGADSGNLLEGDFLYNHSLNAEVPPIIQEGSRHVGRTQVHRGPILDPLKDIEEGSGPPGSTFSGGFQPLTLPRPDVELLTKYSLNYTEVAFDDGDGSQDPPFLLNQDLVLTETENSTGGAISSHYVVDGSVSNRQVIYKGSGLGAGVYVRENRAGMRLQGTVLHVKGDLDLSGTVLPDIPGDPQEQKIDIVGAGATLIVDGQLILGNATINAQDQGFVIYARDIVLKGGGDFFGLIIAENSITILSNKEAELNIKGGLLCAGLGGILLKGTNVEHDPNYLKAINGGGDFVVVSWKKL